MLGQRWPEATKLALGADKTETDCNLPVKTAVRVHVHDLQTPTLLQKSVTPNLADTAALLVILQNLEEPNTSELEGTQTNNPNKKQETLQPWY